MREQGTVYLVATPIGNLGDITYRAVEILRRVDFIAAEDTRVTMKLLNHLQIKKPLLSYFEHNKVMRGAQIIERVKRGESCALVTDAGMPGISDPGADLIKACQAEHVPYTVLPGPCAAVAALVLSGLETGRFCFEGFLSVNKNARKKRLQQMSSETRTMIFYEAPHKLRRTLADLYEALGERPVTLVRELTKLHEQILPTSLKEAVAYYEQRNPKGEYVLIVAGCPPSEPGEQPIGMSIAAQVTALEAQGLTRMEAMKQTAKARGVPKREIYDALLTDREWQRDQQPDDKG